jgi:hypothetical protein
MPLSELRYAAVAREMAETGDWLLPRLNGEPYRDKPPLFFWLSAAARRLGCGVKGGLVLNALASAGTVAATAALGGLWLSARASVLSAAILLTTVGFARMGRHGELDMPLAFFTTLAAYGWFAGGRRVALFYVGIGLGLMVKGPGAVLVPLCALLAGRLARLGPAAPRAPLHPAWGLPVVLLPLLCWLVPAAATAGPSYLRELVVHHCFDRVVDSFEHRQPFWFYVKEGPQNSLPWFLLAVPAGVVAWRRRREEAAPAMLLLWLLLGIAAFSAVSGKRFAYVLPLAPPFALLAARGIEALLVERRPPERVTALLLRVACWGLAALGAGIAWFGLRGDFLLSRLRLDARMAEALRPLTRLPGGALGASGGLLVLGLGAFALLLARRKRHLASVWTVAAATAAFVLVADFAFVPRIDTCKSPRAVAEGMDALVPPGGGGIGLYPTTYHAGFNLYSRRLRLALLRRPEEVVAFLGAPERRLVLARRSDLAAARPLAGQVPQGVRVLEAGSVDRVEMVYLVNFGPGSR